MAHARKVSEGARRRPRVKRRGLCTPCGRRKAAKNLGGGFECVKCFRYYRAWERAHRRAK